MNLPLNFTAGAWIGLLFLWAGLTFSPALVEISVAVCLILWLVQKIKSRFKISGLNWRLGIPLLSYLTLCLLSYFWSEVPALSFRGSVKVSKHVLIFVMVADLFREESRRRVFENFFMAWTWIVIADALFQYAFGHDLLRHFPAEPASAGLRISGSFGTYGKFAVYLILVLPYLWFVALHRSASHRPWLRWYFTFPAFAASLWLLYFTRSRGAVLAFGAGLLIMLCLKKKFRYLLLLALIAAGGLLILPRSAIIHLDAEGKEQSLVERYYLWDRALHVIQAKPWTGTGINTYAVSHQRYDKTQNWRVRNYYAHNGYLQLAAETGILGLLSFLIFLGVFFTQGMRTAALPDPAAKLRLGLLTGVLNFLLFAACDTVLHNPQPVMTFWFLMGLHQAYLPQRNASTLLDPIV